MKKEMIAGEVSLVYDTYEKRNELQKLSSPSEVENFVRPFFEDVMNYKERMVAVFCNQQNKVLGVCRISDGGVTGTVCDSRLIFQTALLLNATGFIVVHNHPSGNLNSSDQDIQLTKTLKSCGEIMNITLIDSLIITEDSYSSILNNM